MKAIKIRYYASIIFILLVLCFILWFIRRVQLSRILEQYKDPQNKYAETLLHHYSSSGAISASVPIDTIPTRSRLLATSSSSISEDDVFVPGWYAVYTDTEGEPFTEGTPGTHVDSEGRVYKMQWFDSSPSTGMDVSAWDESRHGRPRFSVSTGDSCGPLRSAFKSSSLGERETVPFSIKAAQPHDKTSSLEEIKTDRISSKKTKRVRFVDDVNFGEANFQGDISLKGHSIFTYDDKTNTMSIG